MSAPSGWSNLGNTVSGAIRGSRENAQLEDILGKIQNQQAPKDIGAMLQRLSPERQQIAMNALSQQRQSNAYREAGLNPNLPESLNKELLKSRSQKSGIDSAGTLSAIDELEKLSSQTGIGLTGQINPSEEGRYNRGRFQSLQAKLLPLFKGMFPRGMTEKEFKFIQQNYIPQAGDTEAKIKGKLQGLRELASEQAPMNSSEPKKSEFVSIRDPAGIVRSVPKEMLSAAQQAGGILVQ